MLIEVTADEVGGVTPIAPTWEQYTDYWNSAILTTQRILVSILVGVGLLVLSRLFTDSSFFSTVLFLGGMLGLLYPFLWGPLFVIARRNLAFRELPYSGLFFGQVFNVRTLNVVVEEREKVSAEGEIFIEQVRERQFELEMGDEDGSRYVLRVKDDPRFRSIVRNQTVLALVKAYSPDLQRRPVVSEAYIVSLGEWLGDVSYLKRDRFLDLADQILEAEGWETTGR